MLSAKKVQMNQESSNYSHDKLANGHQRLVWIDHLQTGVSMQSTTWQSLIQIICRRKRKTSRGASSRKKSISTLEGTNKHHQQWQSDYSNNNDSNDNSNNAFSFHADLMSTDVLLFSRRRNVVFIIRFSGSSSGTCILPQNDGKCKKEDVDSGGDGWCGSAGSAGRGGGW